MAARTIIDLFGNHHPPIKDKNTRIHLDGAQLVYPLFVDGIFTPNLISQRGSLANAAVPPAKAGIHASAALQANRNETGENWIAFDSSNASTVVQSQLGPGDTSSTIGVLLIISTQYLRRLAVSPNS